MCRVGIFSTGSCALYNLLHKKKTLFQLQHIPCKYEYLGTDEKKRKWKPNKHFIFPMLK